MNSHKLHPKSIFQRFKVEIHAKYVRAKNQPFEFSKKVITFIGVAGCAWVVWLAMQPHLIFTNTTPTGGDMGAHVWWPAFMKDYLLVHGRIFGWTMDYYSGFPVGQYYFPVPALMVLFFNILLPYNIAFKIVTVIGSVALPICAYVLGRCIKAPRPIPMFMSFAATSFLFFMGDPRGKTDLIDYSIANGNHHIMGGPLLSSMAGEFSFIIALSFALLFLGCFYRMLRDGKSRALVAILLPLTILSHLVVGIFVGIAALIFWGSQYISRKGITRYIGYALLVWISIFALCIGSVGRFFFDNDFELQILLLFAACIAIISILIFGLIKYRTQTVQVFKDSLPLIVGFLLSSIWFVPLLARFGYTSNMRYEKITDNPLTPKINELLEMYIIPSYWIKPIFVPAAIGIIISVTLFRKNIIPVVITTIIMAVVFKQWPEGHAWNLRFLPFYYVFLLFVAAAGYGEILRIPTAMFSYSAYKAKNRTLHLTSKIASVVLPIAAVLIFFVALVGFGPAPKDKASGCLTEDTRVFKDRRGYAHNWAEYNFEGYERRGPAAENCKVKRTDFSTYDEFKSIMDAMKQLPSGRALWEPSDGSYGTTLALMLIPYYTNHRIASNEGLYYEAAGSTAYHFLTVAEVSKQPSNPMRWPKCEIGVALKDQKDPNCVEIDYGNINDFARGVKHMQMMGINYFLAQSTESITAAKNNTDLELIKTIPDRDGTAPMGWSIFRVKDSPLVVPLAVNPVVVTDKTKTSDWSQSGNKWLHEWFNSPGQFPVLTNGGPDSWERMTAAQALENPLTDEQQNKESDVKVTDIQTTQDSVSFHVDKTGVPILIKTSYYPTFQVSGAKGIYRASPNYMVVVPTQNDVKIEMKRDKVEWLSIILFLLGIAGVVFLSFDERKSYRQLSKLLARKG